MLLMLCVLFSGCATMRSKSVYSVPIHTIPERANVSVTDRNGRVIINTQSPDTLVLKSGAGYFKRAKYLIEISHKGYQTKEEALFFIIDRHYRGNFWIPFLMPIGFLIVDPISGAMWTPERQEIEVILNPAPADL